VPAKKDKAATQKFLDDSDEEEETSRAFSAKPPPVPVVVPAKKDKAATQKFLDDSDEEEEEEYAVRLAKAQSRDTLPASHSLQHMPSSEDERLHPPKAQTRGKKSEVANWLDDDEGDGSPVAKQAGAKKQQAEGEPVDSSAIRVDPVVCGSSQGPFLRRKH
jgi:hypothetical protein